VSIIQKLSVGLFLLVVCSSLALAQGGATGAISGTVQDASGLPIAGAAVQITNEATGEALRKITTDTSGTFIASLLPVGAYTIEVSAAGFATTKFPGVEVRITETTRITAAVKLILVGETPASAAARSISRRIKL